MDIVVLNGAKNAKESKLTERLDYLLRELSAQHSMQNFVLEDMDVHSCLGCWSCWCKSPGLCVLQDDAEKIFKAVIHADLVIMASPIIAGFTSALLKMITDRLIVLMHPYIEFIQGESHHQKRYDKYPELGLLLLKEKDTDEEDLEIIEDIYHRLALNFHTKLRFLRCFDELKKEGAAHEIGLI